jgi:hypothetical protein
VWSTEAILSDGHCLEASAFSAESCIREAVVAYGLSPGLVGLADTKAEDEAATRWADFAFDYGD